MRVETLELLARNGSRVICAVSKCFPARGRRAFHRTVRHSVHPHASQQIIKKHSQCYSLFDPSFAANV